MHGAEFQDHFRKGKEQQLNHRTFQADSLLIASEPSEWRHILQIFL